jgi:hypothetical protein
VCNTLFYFTEKSFTEYIKNNISTPHVLHGSDLKFTYQPQGETSSTVELNIFLMVNNHNIISGDMYSINMNGQIYGYGYSVATRNTRIWNVDLRKCTSLRNSGSSSSLPGEIAQRWCNVQTSVSIFQFWF